MTTDGARGPLALLTPDDRQRLLARARWVTFPDRHTIVLEGSEPRALYVVGRGTAVVERSHVGHSIRLARLIAGDAFGEMSFVEDRGASASVIADGPIEVGIVDAVDVECLLEDPAFSARFHRSISVVLSGRVRALEDRFAGVEVLRDRSFVGDASLRGALAELVAPSYVDATPLLDRELAHCDTLYLYHEDGRPAFFFMIAWEEIPSDDGCPISAVYLGLSAARSDLKNSGAIRTVYLRAASEVMERQRRDGVRRLVWATTATPSTYFTMQLLTGAVEPQADGSHTEAGARLAHLIRRAHRYPPTAPGGHPFVLSGVAVDTRYSDAECDRIARICQAKQFDLFRNLGIAESRGDRLLLVSWLPEPQPRVR